VACGGAGGPCGCVAADAAAAGFQCTPESAAQAAAVCAQLPPNGNATRGASFARAARGPSFAAGDAFADAAASGTSTVAAQNFTFYGQCAPGPCASVLHTAGTRPGLRSPTFAARAAVRSLVARW
jgi:hypothetical protein